MNALPILLLGGAAVMLMAGGKKKKKKACPKEIAIHITEDMSVKHTYEVESGEIEISWFKIVDEEIAKGNNNPLAITKKALLSLIPPGCSIENKNVTVDLYIGAKKMESRPLPEVFYGMTSDIGEDMGQAGILNNDEMRFYADKLRDWWRQVMGDTPFPEV